ncbi:MAG: sigma-54-dependent Fis family transcriptional regulator [Planctomycetes bacterium]|nr:sigma-54-dependent Fis family transcriptional regulator [Planctomycetota bacterium]
MAESGPALLRLSDLIRRIAAAGRAPVLIEAEWGSGSGAIARAIHDQSPRSSAPFIAATCAALADHLEDELFGSDRGGGRGSDSGSEKRTALIDAAAGGTLFLDEVAEVPAVVQAKLARVLDHAVFRRCGGSTDLVSDARLVVATSHDLAAAVEAGRFRADLYHLLRSAVVTVPPLRSRPEDVLPFAEAELARCAKRIGKDAPKLSSRAKDALLAHRWPGNERELALAMERAAILTEVDITPEDLSLAEPRADGEPGALVIPPGERNLAVIETMVLRAVLRETGGQKTRASELLGINRTTLYNKLRAMGLR